MGGPDGEHVCRPPGERRHARGWMYLSGLSISCAGQTGRVLADQLTDTQTPCLILQGDRDPFGTLGEIKGYRLSAAIDVHFLGDGEHSFIPRKSSRRIKTENWETAIKEMIRFISSID